MYFDVTKEKRGLLMQESAIASGIIFILGILGIWGCTFYLTMLYPTSLEAKIAGTTLLVFSVLFILGLSNIINHIISNNKEKELKEINIFSIWKVRVNLGSVVLIAVIAAIVLSVLMILIALKVNENMYMMQNADLWGINIVRP